MGGCVGWAQVTSYVRAMEATGMDAMTSFVDFMWGEMPGIATSALVVPSPLRDES